ncbi:MAG: SRPBCC family protein [Actinomycetota bacterium]|nr:SRPBCC family protein [Actinomycetota bacterium]
MRPIEVSAHVAESPDQVFDFVSDTRNDPLWCLNVETVEQVEGSGVEVGARFRFHQHLDRPGGGRIEFDGEVEVLELGDRVIVWRATDKFQERLIRLGVETDGAGSRVTQVTTATFQRPPGIVRWIYPRLARRTFREQFEQLDAHFGG